MKTITKLFVLLFILGLFSCKKKKDEEEATPAPAPSAPVAARGNTMSATINGTLWAVTKNQTSTADIEIGILNTKPKTYVVTGRTQSLAKNSIYIGFTYTTGVVSLETFGNYYATYDDADGTGYFAKTGTLNIIAIDTSHKKSTGVDKFQATFSFVTSAIGSNSYTVNEGVIDFEAK